MNVPYGSFIAAAAFFGVIFTSGFALRHSGKPYGALLFNAHKLIALGALAFFIVTVNRARQTAPLTPLAAALSAAVGICFAAAIISGGLVSIDRPIPAAVRVLHKALPYLTLASTAWALWEIG